MAAFDANCTAGINFAAAEDSIKINVTEISLQVDVTNSSVGNIPADLVKFLDPIINELLKGVIIPIVNKKFPGIPIPTVAGVDISGFSIKVEAGRLAVALDIDIHPSQLSIVQNRLNQRRLADAALPPGFSGPGFTATVREPAMTKWLNAFLPQITQEVNKISVPAISGKASGIHYSVDSIHVQGFNIDSSAFVFLPGKAVQVNLNDVEVSLPSTHFEIEKKDGGHLRQG